MVTVEVSKIRGNSNASDEMGIVVVVDRPKNMIDLIIVVLTSPCQREINDQRDLNHRTKASYG